MRNAYFGQGNAPYYILSYNFYCSSNETALFECPTYRRQCRGSQDVGVRCKDDRLRVKNISIAIISATCNTMQTQSVKMSWVIQDKKYRPSSFNLRCFNHEPKHSIELSVDNETFMTQLGGLLSSASHYNCCVSAVYGSYVTDETCTLLRLSNEQSNLSQDSTTETRANVIGGILGAIIAVLLIIIFVCGGMLLFLLRSKSFKR